MNDKEARETLDFYVASRLCGRSKPLTSTHAAVNSKSSMAALQESSINDHLVCELSLRAVDVENVFRERLLTPKIHLTSCSSDSTHNIRDMVPGKGLSIPRKTSGLPKRRVVICSKCDFKTLWPESLRRHEASFHGQVDVKVGKNMVTKRDEIYFKRYACSACLFISKFKQSVFRHISSKHAEVTAFVKVLPKKLAIKKKTPFRCKSSLSRNVFQLHDKMKIVHGAEKSAAPSYFIKAVFKQRLILSRIRANAEFTNKATAVCATDSNIHTNPLSPQEEVEDTVQLWHCDRCPYRINEVTFFRRHMSLHAANHRYTCIYHCNYSVPSYWWLDQHHQLHLHENRNLLSSQSVKNLMLIPQRVTSIESSPPKNGLLKLFEESSDFSSQNYPSFQCSRCPFVARRRQVFLEHVRCHNLGLCCYCDYSTHFPKDFHSHLMSHFNLPGHEMSPFPSQSRFYPLWESVIAGFEAYVESVARDRDIQNNSSSLAMVDSQQEMDALLMETMDDEKESHENHESVASNLQLVAPSNSHFLRAMSGNVTVKEESSCLCSEGVDTPPCYDMDMCVKKIDNPLSNEMSTTPLSEDLIVTCSQSFNGLRSAVDNVVMKTDVTNGRCKEGVLNFPDVSDHEGDGIFDEDMVESILEYGSKDIISDHSSVMVSASVPGKLLLCSEYGSKDIISDRSSVMVSASVPGKLLMCSEGEATISPSKSLLNSTVFPDNTPVASEVEALISPNTIGIGSETESAMFPPMMPGTSMNYEIKSGIVSPAKSSISSEKKSAVLPSNKSTVSFQKMSTIMSCFCQYCDRAFSSSHQLQIHENAHLIGNRFET